MKIEDVFRIETTGAGRSAWRLVPRRPIETRDGKMLTGTGDPLPPQVRAVKKAPHPMIYRRRTHDTVISTPTPEENAAWSKRMATMAGMKMGQVWSGDLTELGEKVMQVADALRRVRSKDKRRAKDAVAQALCAIANYGSYLETSEADLGPADVLSFEGNDELTLSDVHEANGITPSKASVGDSGGAQLRAWRDKTANDVASINSQNAAFWGKQTAHQRAPDKEWGKG